jgi:hypothetical protein
MSVIMSIGQKPDISQGPLSKSQGQGQGALKQIVANQSMTEEHHPLNTTQNKTRSAWATWAIQATCIQNKRVYEVG